MKKLILIALVLSTGAAMAHVRTRHPQPPPRQGYSMKICRECDGYGEVRNWYGIGWTRCDFCKGLGWEFLMLPPPPKPVVNPMPPPPPKPVVKPMPPPKPAVKPMPSAPAPKPAAKATPPHHKAPGKGAQWWAQQQGKPGKGPAR